jgi:hypothetical protein
MIFLLTIALGVTSAILNGWVLSVMWGWFIVPVFAAPTLRIPYAIGLALVFGMLAHQSRKSEHTPDVGESLMESLLLPLFVLGIGWIVKLFV